MQAQELNAKLTINSQKVQSANREVFTSMERDVTSLLNDQRWTDATFNRTERIDCIISVTIDNMPTDASFVAEIQLTSRRPVYNSTYVTPTFNYKDSQLEFAYIPGQSLDYNNNNVRDNLVAVISYYAYILIGLDFDSFSLNGGQPYFAKAMNIANMAQTLNTKGWESFTGSKASRYDLAVALTDDAYKSFHSLWYTYHRSGLDEMAANPSRGRINIMEAMNDLQKIADSRPTSPLLVIFSEAKLDELIKICSTATADEKKEMKKKLLKMYPAKSNIINELQ